MSINKKVISQLKKRDEKAFDVVYYQYVNLIYHIIYKLVENKNDADDLTQDTLIQMMASIESFNENNNFKYWLLQIARNKALDFLKKRRPIINHEFINEIPDLNVRNHDQSDFNEMMQQYKGVINKDEFDIITLHLFHGLKFKEIAELYDKTTSSVNNMYHRGSKKIRKQWR